MRGKRSCPCRGNRHAPGLSSPSTAGKDDMDARADPGAVGRGDIAKRSIAAVDLGNVFEADGRLYLCLVTGGKEWLFEIGRRELAGLIGRGALRLSQG